MMRQRKTMKAIKYSTYLRMMTVRYTGLGILAILYILQNARELLMSEQTLQ